MHVDTRKLMVCATQMYSNEYVTTTWNRSKLSVLLMLFINISITKLPSASLQDHHCATCELDALQSSVPP